MTPMLSLAATPMQKIYEQTCLELVRELSKDLVKDVPTNDSFTSINGLASAVEDINFTSGVNNLMKKYHNPGIYHLSGGRGKAWSMFKDTIEITKVGSGDMSINDAIAMIGPIYKEIGDNLYGMLLMDSRKGKKRQIINPLHPLIVSNIKNPDRDFKLDEKNWTIAIYSFREKGRSIIKNALKDQFTKTDYMPEIASLIASIDNPSLYFVENKNFAVEIENDQFVLNYEEVKTLKDSGEILKEEDSVGRSYLIPGQIINISGVAYPYYGTIYSTKGLAWNLTPMYGANVSHPEGQARGSGMEGGSRICTHSGNSKTQMGVSSLNHCNTTSPLNSECMEAGSMTYAEQCVSSSIELLLGDEFITGLSKEDKALTFQEFVTENDGATKKQYLLYIKNRLTSKMEQGTNEVVAKSIDVSAVNDITDHTLWREFKSGEGFDWADGTISHTGFINGVAQDPKMIIGSSWRDLDSQEVAQWLADNEYVGIDPEQRQVEPGEVLPFTAIMDRTDPIDLNTIFVNNQEVTAFGEEVPLTEEERELVRDLQAAQVVA